MKILGFISFYSSVPFWANNFISSEELEKIEDEELKNKLEEIVFSKDNDDFSIKIAQDGMIILRVYKLENKMIPWSDRLNNPNYTISNDIKNWNDYIEYLNTFYLLLDSSLYEIEKETFLETNELTKKDVMRAYFAYFDSLEKFQGCQSASHNQESIEIYKKNRLPDSNYHLIKSKNNRFINKKVLEHTVQNFEYACKDYNLIKILSTLLRSISEYKEGNNQTSILFSWFIIESIIIQIWEKHINSLNNSFDNGSKRINKARKKHLESLSISVIINLLELMNLIPYELYIEIDKIRLCRNKIVHIDQDYVSTNNDAKESILCTKDLIKLNYNLEIFPNLNLIISPITI